MKEIKRGIQNGIPVGLGYLSVSFSFGAICIASGLSWWQAMLISVCNFTSAGQFAGISIMVGYGSYMEMAIVQFVVNIRYAFMSLSLSQKVDDKFKGVFKWLLSYFITDEFFALAMLEKSVSRQYFFGMILSGALGWMGGTCLGAILGSLVPNMILNALGIALYAMFIGIIVPGMKKDHHYIPVVALAIMIRCLFYYLPGLNTISGGFAMTISALISAMIGSVIKNKEVIYE